MNWLYDFGLLCESESHLKMVSYLLLVGICTGSLIVAPLADYFGRKGMIVFTLILLCLMYLKLVFTADVITCSIVMYCTGVLIGTYYTTAVSYLTEITTQKTAIVYAGLFHLAFPIAGTTAISLLRVFKDWKPVVTIMSLVPLIFIIYSSCITESPRHLASKGMYDDARYEANVICKYNTGRQKKWKFSYEKATFMKDYADFTHKREGKLFHHFNMLGYPSTRNYLCSFSVLLFFTGFSFAGLALTQQLIFRNSFVDSLVLYSFEAVLLFISVFIVQGLGHIKVIALYLILAAGLGIASVITGWVDDYVHNLTGYLVKLPSFIALVASVSFAAENCPTRIRATGLGMVLSSGILGLIVGGLLLEVFNVPYVMFGIVAGCGILGLIRVKEPSMYLNNDDIYEITEFKKKSYKGEVEEECKVVKTTKDPVVKEMKGFDKPREDIVSFKVEGKCTINETEQPLGFEDFGIDLNGKTSGMGEDKTGKYILEGSMKSSNHVTIAKRYENNTETIYEGVITNNNAQGTVKKESTEGSFEFTIRAQHWEGKMNYEGSELELGLWLSQEEQRIAGFGQTSEFFLFVKGEITDNSKVHVVIANERGDKIEYQGTYDQKEINGENENGKLHLQLTNN
jgi:MFS family permease